MTHEWILVANASRALCFEREQGAADLKLLDEFADPLGRAKGIDLDSDRAGYESTRGGRGSDFAPRTDSRTKEHDSFARRLADYLNHGIAAHRCDALAIIASNPFLGEVKAHLHTQATKALRTTVPKDLTSFTGRELIRRLEEELPPPG